MDEKSTWSPTWQTMDKVSWSPGIYVRPTSRGGPAQIPGDHGVLIFYFLFLIFNYFYIIFSQSVGQIIEADLGDLE